jgi:hypothetical protein
MPPTIELTATVHGTDRDELTQRALEECNKFFGDRKYELSPLSVTSAVQQGDGTTILYEAHFQATSS